MPLTRRLLAILLMLTLGVSAFGRAGISWMCEGRVCSPDLSRCCCASARETRHGSCLKSTGDKLSKSASGCASQCGCQAVVTKVANTPVRTSSHPAFAPTLTETPALPPTIFVLHAYVSLETPQVRAIPPPSGLREPACIERASLRAPPVLTA